MSDPDKGKTFVVSDVEKADLENLRRGKCFNGCDAPVQPPSRVICKACLAELGKRLAALADLARLEEGK